MLLFAYTLFVFYFFCLVFPFLFFLCFLSVYKFLRSFFIFYIVAYMNYWHVILCLHIIYFLSCFSFKFFVFSFRLQLSSLIADLIHDALDGGMQGGSGYSGRVFMVPAAWEYCCRFAEEEALGGPE